MCHDNIRGLILNQINSKRTERNAFESQRRNVANAGTFSSIATERFVEAFLWKREQQTVNRDNT